MTSQARSGRRPGSPDTRGDVLAAARRRFAHDGYSGATIRAIAGEAGVDPALVHHYFGTKRDLFREAVSFPVNPAALVAVMERVPPEQRATELARFFFQLWEDDEARSRLLSVLRSAMTHDDAAGLLRDFVSRELLGPMAARLGIDDAEIRVPLAAAQMIGVAILRYVLRVEPLASLPAEEVVERVAPVLDHHLFG